MLERANDTPDKIRRLQIKLYLAAKRSPSRRFHALYDKVQRTDVLERAWHQVKTNHGAPGIDAETIEAIEASGVQAFLATLQAELASGTYRPQAVRRVRIPKPQGGERLLGVPTVRDRVVQAAVKIVIEPLFEADFANCSFGFRPRRSALQARERIGIGMQRERRLWVVDADIRSFFDELDRVILLALLRRRISDRRVLGLIRSWLEAGVFDQGALLHPEAGTPQGGVISPLLANVYLNTLDQWWQKHCGALGVLTRFADDLVILCEQQDQAERALEVLTSMLAKLRLQLSPTKTRVVGLADGTTGFDFLGFHNRWIPVFGSPRRRHAASWPSQRAMQAARQRIRELTPAQRVGLPISVIVQDINRFLHGWIAYFRYGNSAQQFKSFDRYVKHRLSRFISRKHGRSGPNHGLAVLLESKTQLGLMHASGSVRYGFAHAGGERVRRAV